MANIDSNRLRWRGETSKKPAKTFIGVQGKSSLNEVQQTSKESRMKEQTLFWTVQKNCARSSRKV